MTDNLSAFRDTIAYSEGTYGVGDNGYNVIVGGQLFHDYSKHPDILVTLNKRGLKSTAAGRYQFIFPTWEGLRKSLKLPDFSPASQDRACTELLREARALDDIFHGRFAAAVAKSAHIWASLPNAGYGQRENTLDDLQAWYAAHGGTLTS